MVILDKVEQLFPEFNVLYNEEYLKRCHGENTDDESLEDIIEKLTKEGTISKVQNNGEIWFLRNREQPLLLSSPPSLPLPASQHHNYSTPKRLKATPDRMQILNLTGKLDELKDRYRKLKILHKYREENSNLDNLIIKWKDTADTVLDDLLKYLPAGTTRSKILKSMGVDYSVLGFDWSSSEEENEDEDEDEDEEGSAGCSSCHEFEITHGRKNHCSKCRNNEYYSE